MTKILRPGGHQRQVWEHPEEPEQGPRTWSMIAVAAILLAVGVIGVAVVMLLLWLE